jgi:hypothetical protein
MIAARRGRTTSPRWQRAGWIVYPDASVCAGRLVMRVHAYAPSMREAT